MPVLFNIEYDGHLVLKAIALNRRKTHFLRHLLTVLVSEYKVLFGAHRDQDMQRALQQRLNKGVVPWRDFRDRKTHFLRHLLTVLVSEYKVLFGAHRDQDMQRALQQRLNKGVVPWRDF